MRATMEMPIDTLFGNRITLRVEAELDNPPDATGRREETNREMILNMGRIMRYMLDEVDAENERERKARAEGAEADPYEPTPRLGTEPELEREPLKD